MLYKHFFCDLYRANVILYAFCTTDESNAHYQKHYDKEEKKLFDDQDNGGCVVVLQHSKTGINHYVCWVRDETVSTIVHEAFHLAARVLEEVGVTFTPDNHEPFAYYTEYWFTTIVDEIRKFKDQEQKIKKKAAERKERRRQQRLKEKREATKKKVKKDPPALQETPEVN